MRCTWLVLMSCVALTAACSNDSEQDPGSDTPDRNCRTDYTTYTSPATGILEMQGQFYDDETVIIETRDTPPTVVASGTPATDRTSFTFTGMPSGQHAYYFIVSCPGGRDQDNETFTVK